MSATRCSEWKHFVPQPGASLCDCGQLHAGMTADGLSGIVVRLFRFVGEDASLAAVSPVPVEKETR